MNLQAPGADASGKQEQALGATESARPPDSGSMGHYAGDSRLVATNREIWHRNRPETGAPFGSRSISSSSATGRRGSKSPVGQACPDRTAARPRGRRSLPARKWRGSEQMQLACLIPCAGTRAIRPSRSDSNVD